MTNLPGASTGMEPLRAFVQAAVGVLDEVLGTAPRKGPPSPLVAPVIDLDEVTVGIGLTGDLQGQVVFTMAQATALQVAGGMLGEPVASLDKLATSTLLELTNMIAGNARFSLQAHKLKTEIHPPALLPGRQLRPQGQVRATAVPLDLPAGRITMVIGLKTGS